MLELKSKRLMTVAVREGNLLNHKWVSGFVKSDWFPGIFQWPTVLFFALIVYQLLLGPVVAHDNLGTALTWVLWWPLIPILFLLLGRFWCAICPFGTVSDVVQKFVGHNQPVPKFLKKYGIWIIDASFIAITWGDHVWGIVESPWGSGVLLLLITTGVVAAAALWERRAWCRYLCFLGGLSGNYARTGMLALRATPDICAKCKTSSCYKGNGQTAGCPMFEFPRVMETNAECNICGNCVKACPNDSLRLNLRLPTKELWFIRKPKFEEAFLAVVIMGIVFIQNVTMLDVWNGMLSGLEKITGTQNYAVTFTLAFMIAMGIPIALLAGAAGIAKNLNGDSLAQNFAKFGYAIIPLDVAGHVAHNLFHLLAEGKAVLYTGLAFLGQASPAGSPALVDSATIQLLQYGLIALGALFSLYTAYRIAGNNYGGAKRWATVMPYASLIALLGLANVYLFMLPMSMRM